MSALFLRFVTGLLANCVKNTPICPSKPRENGKFHFAVALFSQRIQPVYRGGPAPVFYATVGAAKNIEQDEYVICHETKSGDLHGEIVFELCQPMQEIHGWAEKTDLAV